MSNYLIDEIRRHRREARTLRHNLSVLQRIRTAEHKATIRAQGEITNGLDRLRFITSPTEAGGFIKQ